MVERIENKKINLNVQCTAHKEENMKANQMYTSFIEKFELVNFLHIVFLDYNCFDYFSLCTILHFCC